MWAVAFIVYWFLGAWLWGVWKGIDFYEDEE